MTGAKCKKNSVLAKNIEKNRNTKQRLKQAKGITLIALVITIVILIILATVTISFVLGENGIIARAEQAAEMTETQNILEQMELAKAEVAMENGGKVNVDDFFNKLEENGVIGSVENDVVDNGDGSYTITTDDGYEFEVTVTPEEEIEIEYTGKGESPRISNVNITKTSNSVIIEVETKNAEGGKFTYSYKKNSEGEESWQEAETNTTSNTCTIENLEANEIYNIKINIETNKGKVEKIVNVQVGEMPVGAVNFASYVWQGDGTASIVINTTEIGYTLQYQVVSAGGGMPDSSSWTDINSGETITGLVYGDTVYGRLWDGTNESDYANATIDDNVMPTISDINVDNVNENSITVTIIANDTQSGLDENKTYKYYINEQFRFEGTNDNYIFTELTASTNYTIRVEVYDKAGNKAEKEKNVKTSGPSLSAEEIVASDYGQIVTNYICPSSGVDTWRIFYSGDADGDGVSNVYLIADDYISLYDAPKTASNSLPMGIYGEYDICLEKVIYDYRSGTSWINQNSAAKGLLRNWINQYPTGANENMQCVAYLMDTNIWSIYKGENADYAIGAPTLELFIESYNKTHPSTKIQWRIANSYGYQVKWESDNDYTDPPFQLKGIKDDMNEIYRIADQSKASGMCLATPSYDYENYIMGTTYQANAIWGVSSDGSYSVGTRPIVCLKSNVKLEKQEDGSYKIK